MDWFPFGYGVSLCRINNKVLIFVSSLLSGFEYEFVDYTSLSELCPSCDSIRHKASQGLKLC